MKLSIKIGVLVLLGTAFLLSCSKEIDTKKPVADENVMSSQIPPGFGIHRHLNTNFPNWGDYWCGYPAINCFDDIVVGYASSEFGVYSIFNEALQNNDLANFFNDANWVLIFPGLSSQIIADLSNGSSKFIKLNSTNSSNTEIWAVVDESVDENDLVKEDVILAMPLEFV